VRATVTGTEGVDLVAVPTAMISAAPEAVRAAVGTAASPSETG
jgi:hypothetical protein